MNIQLEIQPAFALAYLRMAAFRQGDVLRLYVRTGGPGTGGLFFALEKDEMLPGDAVYHVEGLTFVIRPGDFWYFDGGRLGYDERFGEYGFFFENPRLD
ncbi:iron-sulfur cluster biosynthesis family protein [Brevibacillus sp. SYP-B805]|uniref:iron-sulfur cluster biosynthesis family protein n=1 Tax=Brevibacillus sp. SYP-B805 TaxID=1578199 RepID=UPI0013ED2B83|nr:iron-sulfur cluster biosynthesis family protein [Brevibacillus sp. SYP-B805]NGQ96638.1 iron-sulfur cluster biosynthesis family protein [Brevibacillus sp. SYP-B805]